MSSSLWKATIQRQQNDGGAPWVGASTSAHAAAISVNFVYVLCVCTFQVLMRIRWKNYLGCQD